MCPRRGVARESSTHSFCVGVPHALVEGDYLVTNRSRLRVHDSMRLDHLGDARVTLKVRVIRHSLGKVLKIYRPIEVLVSSREWFAASPRCTRSHIPTPW